jgi:hypothetical protein
MKKKNLRLRQILGIMSLVALLVNIILGLGLKLYNELIFWIVIIIIAIIAWPVMNWLKK